MSADDVYPVSARLELDLTIANVCFTETNFRRFCDGVVNDAFARTGYILKSDDKGMHVCAGCDDKLAWHFGVVNRMVTFNRLGDVEALVEELRPLREALQTCGYETREAKVLTDAFLRIRPDKLPSQRCDEQPEAPEGFPGIIVAMEPTSESYAFLEGLYEKGFKVLLEGHLS